jgi:menaquinone-dependent protoporphyrinogen oxidase
VKILVVYGTRWGSTADIAKKIGQAFMNDRNTTDIVDAKKEKPTIDPYDLVVVGSGISMGKWTKETLSFLHDNATHLRNKKTAFFVSCGLVLREGGIEKTRADYLAKVAEEYKLNPLTYGAFGGYLDFTSDYGLLSNLFVNASKKKCQKMGIDTTKPYDFRDWSDITNWAERLSVEVKKA